MDLIKFNLYFGGERVDCIIQPLERNGDMAYEIWFDGRLVAGILPDENTIWRQVLGAPLDGGTIELIGKKIEEHYA